MQTVFIELLKRHFQSEGFKNRARHIYIPFLKMKLAWVWNIYFKYKEKAVFTEIYKTVTPVLDETHDVAGAPVVTNAVLPLYEVIADRLKKFFITSESQGSTSQCVAFTVDNIHRLITKLLGYGEMKVSQLDVYIDRSNKGYDGDGTGMSVQDMYLSVASKGVTVGDILPLIDDQNLMKAVDNRKYFPDAKLAQYRIKLIKSGLQISKDWGNVVSAIQSVPMGYPLQAVLGATDTYFGSDVVYGKYNTFYAGHSVTVIGGSACIVDGQEGFFITDSAYYTGKVYRFGTAIRFITKDFWQSLGYSLFKPVFVDSIQSQADAIKIITTKSSVFVYGTANLNQSNEAVTVIQRALIALGYSLPAGATGYYGGQTASAVMKFQLDHIADFAKLSPTYTTAFFTGLNGKSFGNDSVKVINSVQGL